MGLKSGSVLLQNLAAQSAGTVAGNWFDLGDFVAGAFYLVVTAVTGSITPTFQMSADGTNGGLLTPIPTGELAAPEAVSSTGVTRYPFIGVMQQNWVRVSSVVVTGPVTAKVYFNGRTQ